MMKIVKDLALAIQFLTIFPFFPLEQSAKVSIDDENLAKNFSNSMIYFPLVGLLIGALLVLLNHLLYYISFPILINSALILFVWACISGGLHVDGFADMIDGFSGGKDKNDIMRIMKDSAIGAKGAMALFFIFLLKFVLLVEINLSIRDAALLFIPALSRWSMIVGAFFSQPANLEKGLGRQFMKKLGKRELILSTIIMIIPGIILFKYYFMFLFGSSILVIWLLLKYCQRKIEGITGDVIGALNEIVELFSLLILVIL